MKGRSAALNLVVSLMLVLSLAACSRKVTPPPNNPPIPATPTPEVLSGTIEQWTGEAAVIRALSYNFETNESVVIAEGIINNDGSFSLTLPVDEGVADALFTVDNGNFCETNTTGSNDIRSTIKVTPSSIEFANTGLFVYKSASSSEDEIIGDVLVTDNNYAIAINFNYAVSDVTIKGDCITTSSTDRYDLSFKAGWNKVMAVFNSEGRSLSTEPIPETISWSFFER